MPIGFGFDGVGAGSRVPGAGGGGRSSLVRPAAGACRSSDGVGAIMGSCVWREVTLGVIDCIQMTTPSLLVGATADA